jgi:hypothetical protein
VPSSPSASKHIANNPSFIGTISYFVTELLGTDLHRLLTSRPLEKQFIQYFLYQILVSFLCLYQDHPGSGLADLAFLSTSAWTEIRPLGRCRSPRLEAFQHSGEREL